MAPPMFSNDPAAPVDAPGDPAGALAAVLAALDAAGLALPPPPDEQAAAMIATTPSRPAIRVRRMVRSSMPILLSRIDGPVIRVVVLVSDGRATQPASVLPRFDGAVDARMMSSIGNSVRCGIDRSAIRSRSARPAA